MFTEKLFLLRRKSFKRSKHWHQIQLQEESGQFLPGESLKVSLREWRSMQKMTKEPDIFDRLLKRIVKKDLGLKPCKIQLLSSASKQKRDKQMEENFAGNAVYCSLCLVRWEVFHCGGCGQLSKHNRVYITSFLKVSEYFSSDRHQLGCCCFWCSLKEKWKWISEFTSKCWGEMHCPGCQPHLEVTVFTQDGAFALSITNRWTLLCQCILSTANIPLLYHQSPWAIWLSENFHGYIFPSTHFCPM